jgi:hypothetical protein
MPFKHRVAGSSPARLTKTKDLVVRIAIEHVRAWGILSLNSGITVESGELWRHVSGKLVGRHAG